MKLSKIFSRISLVIRILLIIYLSSQLNVWQFVIATVLIIPLELCDLSEGYFKAYEENE